MPSLRRSLLSGLALLAAACLPASAGEVFPGPVEARVLRVIDGDTFLAEALVWPGHSVRVAVRIRGIDAPEMRGRCAGEKAAARRARAALARLLGDGPVTVSAIGGAKYYGRVLADVADARGRAVAPAMLGLGMARPYGGGRREAFC